MKIIHVTTQWQAYHDLEVPDDWEWDGTLKSLLAVDDLSAVGAELLDWDVTE